MQKCEHYSDNIGDYMGNDMCFCPGCDNTKCQRSMKNGHFKKMREIGKKWGKYDIYSISDFSHIFESKPSIRVKSKENHKKNNDSDEEFNNESVS